MGNKWNCEGSMFNIWSTGAAKVEQEQGKKEKEDQAKKDEGKKVTRCVSPWSTQGGKLPFGCITQSHYQLHTAHNIVLYTSTTLIYI